MTSHDRVRRQLFLIPVYVWLVFAWTAYAINMSPAGRLDRAGLVKGHDFVHFYVLGQIALDRAAGDLYDVDALSARSDRLVPQQQIRFLPVHGPQVALAFAPFAALPYGLALVAWLALTTLVYASCCGALVASLPALRSVRWQALVLAAAFPPFCLLITFGQTSVLALAFVTGAYFALKSDRRWLAGLALGLLFYKPSFGVALPFVLLYGREWKMILGAATAVLLQLVVPLAWFDPSVLLGYWHSATGLGQAARQLEPIPNQMHSLRAFMSLLLPWPAVAKTCYIAAAAGVVGLAAWCWRLRAPLGLRYSVLLLAMVLADPHVNPYDLVVLAPVFVLAAAFGLETSQPPAFWVVLYLSYYLPAWLDLSRFTGGVQVSVIAFVALSGLLARGARRQHTPWRPPVPAAAG
jgi:Glycosyltransferase family 87